MRTARYRSSPAELYRAVPLDAAVAPTVPPIFLPPVLSAEPLIPIPRCFPGVSLTVSGETRKLEKARYCCTS